MKRQRRKSNKMRGMRTHGAGNKKNRRGKGVRGGVGKAGSHKHKFSKYYVDFGVKSTFKPRPKPEAMNLETISNSLQKWVKSGKVAREEGYMVVDGKALGFGKILGRGSVSEKIKIQNAKASKQASRKIIAAGGIVPGVEAAPDDEFEAEEEEAEGGAEEKGQ